MKFTYSYITLLISSLIMLLLSCNKLVDDVSVELTYKKNFKAVVKFSTPSAKSAKVVYWQEGNEIKDTTSLSPISLQHEVNLYGLVPNSTYSYQLLLVEEEGISPSKTYSFKVDSLPPYIPTFKVVKKDGKGPKGYILLRHMLNPGTQLIVNSSGKVIWYQVSDSTIFRPFSISGKNAYIALKTDKYIVEVTFEGDTITNLKFGTNDFTRSLHHDILRDDKNSILALTKEYKVFNLANYGGTKQDSVAGDGIVLLDNKGHQLWHWSIFDQEVIASQQLYKSRRDWSHANGLCRDTDGNFLVSFRNFNQIWKINKDDGHIVWKLGVDGDFKLSPNELFSGQHAVHINPHGNLMIFDNSMNPAIKSRKGKRSRALAFRIDEENMVATKTLDVRLPSDLYSFKQGSVYFIDHDKLLFCSSMTKKIVIADLKGNILWQLNSPQSFYRAVYLKKLPWK